MNNLTPPPACDCLKCLVELHRGTQDELVEDIVKWINTNRKDLLDRLAEQ